MVNYQNGKIYKLWSDESDCFYIGSTTQQLCRRLDNHKSFIKRSESQTYIDMQNHTNIRIELIEDFPCKSKDELERREGHHIRLNRDNLLNKNIPGRTRQEYHEEYYEDHKEALLKYCKEWHEDHKEDTLKYRIENREAILKQKKEYHIVNKEAINMKKKEFYEKNKDEINKRRREKRKRKAE